MLLIILWFFGLGFIDTCHYPGDIINLSTYSKKIDRKIFDQFNIVDHVHTIFEVLSLDL
jgi:hypothetical protein